MSNTATISILIAAYNAQKTLDKCLLSVCKQTFSSIEIIVINDGSTDGTASICNHFKEIDPRIKIINQENKGVSKTRNTAIKLATAPYLCFVDADDWVEPDYCQTLYQNLIDYKADISIIGASFDNPDQSATTTTSHTTTNNIEEFTNNQAINLIIADTKIQSHPWGKLYDKKLFEGLYFPTDREAFEDYALIFKVFSRANKVVINPSIKYHYIQFTESLSHNLTPMRAYHFFLAIIDMYQFAVSIKSQINDWQGITKKTLKQSFMTIKRILRNTQATQMETEIQNIKQNLQPFLKYSVLTIGFGYYFYLRLFLHQTPLYKKFISLKNKK